MVNKLFSEGYMAEFLVIHDCSF